MNIRHTHELSFSKKKNSCFPILPDRITETILSESEYLEQIKQIQGYCKKLQEKYPKETHYFEKRGKSLPVKVICITSVEEETRDLFTLLK